MARKLCDAKESVCIEKHRRERERGQSEHRTYKKQPMA